MAESTALEKQKGILPSFATAVRGAKVTDDDLYAAVKSINAYGSDLQSTIATKPSGKAGSIDESVASVGAMQRQRWDLEHLKSSFDIVATAMKQPEYKNGLPLFNDTVETLGNIARTAETAAKQIGWKPPTTR